MGQPTSTLIRIHKNPIIINAVLIANNVVFHKNLKGAKYTRLAFLPPDFASRLYFKAGSSKAYPLSPLVSFKEHHISLYHI
jgi:hypothetical protein